MNFFWKGINTFHDSSGFRTRIVGWSNSCAIASSNNPPYSQFTATMHNCGCEGLYSCLKVCRSAAQVGWMRRRRGLISGQRSTFSLCTIPLSPRRHLRRSVRDAARGGSGGGGKESEEKGEGKGGINGQLSSLSLSCAALQIFCCQWWWLCLINQTTGTGAALFAPGAVVFVLINLANYSAL